MLIVANYKMNGSNAFHLGQIKKLNKIKTKGTNVVLCPSFVYLHLFKIKNKNVFLGAQDVSAEENGKSTGQTSAKMLAELGVKYVIVGHSERRKLGETDQIVALKVKSAISHNLVPIICIGENEGENLKKTITTQLKSALKFANSSNKIVLAYEPVWAIGTGKTPTAEEIENAVKIIKTVIKKFNINATILYGGSVNENNFEKLKTSQVDGFLLGGVSMQTDSLLKIILGV